MTDKRYVTARVGSREQIAYARRSTVNEGKADGMRIIHVENGGGVSCVLLESRCLDIARLAYRGVNLGFLAKPGLVAPHYCSPLSGEFTRYFQAGMLYTCGLDNVGPDGSNSRGALPMHGRLGMTPAEEVSSVVDWDDQMIKIKGKIRQATLFGENLLLERSLLIPLYGKEILIEDSVENVGFKKEEIMLLYHINFGWPLLSEDTLLKVKNDEYVVPRDQDAKKGIDTWNTFEAPMDEYPEQVFYHRPMCSDDEMTHVCVWNKKLELGVNISFDPKILPYLIEWKSMAAGDYALGIEPSTCYVGGRDEEKKAGRMQLLEPGEKKKITINLKVCDDRI